MAGSEGKRKKTALDAPRGSFFWLSPSDPRLKIVGLDTSHKKGDHPLWDSRAFRDISKERIGNFRHYGIKKSILIRIVDDDNWLVVDGRGRLIGARIIEKEQIAAGESPTLRIKVEVEKGDDKHVFGLARALNTHDADDAITNAENARRYMDDYGASLAEVAQSFGVSEQTVRNWLQLLESTPEVLEAIQAGELTPTAATAIASLPAEEQAETLEELKRESGGKKITAARAQSKAREKSGKAPTAAPKEKLKRIVVVLTKLCSDTDLKKDDLLSAVDKICRITTGYTFEQFCNIGD